MLCFVHGYALWGVFFFFWIYIPEWGCSLDNMRSAVIFLMYLCKKFTSSPNTVQSVSLKKTRSYFAVVSSSTVYYSGVWEGIEPFEQSCCTTTGVCWAWINMIKSEKCLDAWQKCGTHMDSGLLHFMVSSLFGFIWFCFSNKILVCHAKAMVSLLRVLVCHCWSMEDLLCCTNRVEIIFAWESACNSH